MAIHDLLNTLDGVKKTGPSRWIAKCPAHGDKRASLAITEKDDGRVLMHCFAGCGIDDVLGAVGLEFDALYPPKNIGHARPERKSFNPYDVLQLMAFESWLVFLTAKKLANGEALNQADQDRLLIAAGKLEHASGIARGRHG